MSRLRIALLAVLGLALAAPAARAAFETENPGARAAGLAGAFCAAADDADALLYNPAGLARMTLTTISANYARLLTGLNDGAFIESRVAFAQPLAEAGTLGVVWHHRNLLDLYQENLVTLGYAAALDGEGAYRVGGSLKMLRADYLDASSTADNPYFSGGTSAMGFAADAGVQADLGAGFGLGLALANVGQPDLSLHHGGAVVPVHLRAGLAWSAENLLVAADWLRYAENQRVAVGGEAWWFKRVLGTRLGYAVADTASEAAAGLSLVLLHGEWSVQMDYAFVAPLGAFAGAGPTHTVNLALMFGSLDPEMDRGLKLKAEGERLFGDGRLQEAAEAWEQAVELLPNDNSLSQKLEQLRADLNRRSEIELYIKEGRDFQKTGNYQNAANAYRKVLALDPRHALAAGELRTVISKLEMQALNQNQQEQKAAEEQRAAERARQTRLRAADDALQAARRALDKTRRLTEGRRALESELRRLEKLLNAAEGFRAEEQGERAQVAAQAVTAGAERLAAKAARRVAADKPAARAAEPPAEPAAKAPEAAAPAVPAAATVPPAELAAAKPADDLQRRRARGAYGRSVKLMLDVDRVQGRKYFPEEYGALQNEMARIKLLLNGEDYPAVIQAAEAIFPRLEKLQTRSEEKNKAREVMPTNW